MIPIHRWKTPEACSYLEKICSRGPKGNAKVESEVAVILKSVRERGDEAVREFTHQFDGCDRRNLRIDPSEIQRLASQADPKLRQIIRQAKQNIWFFHQHQKENSWNFEAGDGVRLGQRVRPLQSVGLYVPGGIAAYPSTVLMNAIPAQIAGVARIVVVTPYPQFQANPVVAVVLEELGLEEVYGLGGAQAIGALAYGTTTIPKVDKIVGPGNPFVAEAKKQVFGRVDIDMIAGPSEVVVVADEFTDPALVAADLMAQAEHDEAAVAVAITLSSSLAEAIQTSLTLQIKDLTRQTTIRKALQEYGAILVVKQPEEAVQIVNQVAPEHLELLTKNAEALAAGVDACGAIFFGSDSCEPIGDYFAGPNHVLPTGGTARFSSPLGVYDFIKRTNLIKYSRAALLKHHNAIQQFALAEGLDAHAWSVRVRMEKTWED